MTTAHLTPTLDTCEALKTVGFPQDTVFVWASWAEQPQARSASPHGVAGQIHSGERAAPTLTELLAHLPAELAFALPHPIFGSTERAHTLEVSLGCQAVIGYHISGSHEVQHRVEHDSAVEAAARLYLALHAAGRLGAPRSEAGRPEAMRAAEPMAQAA